jgi:hypothetical protein
MQTTTQQVRQVLVNELGLTRESVREQAREFVAPIVEAEVRRLIDQGGINELVRDCLARMSRERGATLGLSVRDMVRQEAEKAMRDWVAKNVRIGEQ